VLTICEHASSKGAAVLLMTMPMRPPTAEDRRLRALTYSGVAEHNEILRELAREHGWMLADAERVFAEQPELAHEFTDTVHLKQRGNRAKAQCVIDVLVAEWLPELGAVQ
jgi:hypothetical protein